MLWLGIVLVLFGAAIGFGGDELKHSTETLYFRLAFELLEVGMIALGGALIGTKLLPRIIPQRPKGDQELIDASKWTNHEVESDRYKAQEQISTISTKTGAAFLQRLRILAEDSNKVVAEFSVIKIYDGSYWNFERSDKIYVGNRRPVILDEELESEHIKELLEHVDFALCFGLVSSAECSSQDAEGLSIARAARLEDWFRFSGVMVEQAITVRPVPLGKARTKYKINSKEERAQRSAIIVGVKFDNEFISLSQALDELRIRMRSEAVRLDDYPNSIRP